MSEDENDSTKHLRAISVIFEYGIPAILIVFGYQAYLNSFGTIIPEMHDLGLALMMLGILLFFIELVAKQLVFDPEDKLIAPLNAISMVFAYGIPTLLIILGFIAYFRAPNIAAMK